MAGARSRYRSFRWSAAIVALIASWIVFSLAAQAQLHPIQHDLDSALRGTPDAAVVLDGRDGRLLAVERRTEAGTLTSAPGSTLKPFFLNAAIQAGLIRPDFTVLCQRRLYISGHDLACTHPASQNVFDAETALTYSCNSYFAKLAMRFSPQQAVAVLRGYGFGSRTGLLRPEAAGIVSNPESQTEMQLLVLGLQHVEVTPLQLARGYMALSTDLAATPAVDRGLAGSVSYGMAHNAATPGLTILGKTGTASDSGRPWTHGWFAGIASRDREKIIVVIYVPHGNGADAALMAHRFFARWERTAR
jgi:cell division protein FtsI/penicillin-binding protein 2